MRELNFHEDYNPPSARETRCAFCHRPSGDGSHEGCGVHHLGVLMGLPDSGGGAQDAYDEPFLPTGLPQAKECDGAALKLKQLKLVPDVYRLHQPPKRRGRPSS